MTKILALLICLLCVTSAQAQFAPAFSIPHSGGGGGGCSNNGPLDVVSETGIEAVGLRALKKSYTGKVVYMSLTGTSGTYYDVGLAGCDLDITGSYGGNTISLNCTSASAPTTGSGCPIKTFHDQSGSGCDLTQPTGANQAWVVTNTANGHPTVYFGGSAYYNCTLGTAVGTSTSAGEYNMTNTGSSYFIETIEDGSNYDTRDIYSSTGSGGACASYDGSTTSVSGGTTTGSYINEICSSPNSASVILLDNGSSGPPGSSVTTVLTGTHMDLGAGISAALPGTFKMGEFVIVSIIPNCSGTMGDCQLLYNNQSAYW